MSAEVSHGPNLAIEKTAKSMNLEIGSGASGKKGRLLFYWHNRENKMETVRKFLGRFGKGRLHTATAINGRLIFHNEINFGRLEVFGKRNLEIAEKFAGNLSSAMNMNIVLDLISERQRYHCSCDADTMNCPFRSGYENGHRVFYQNQK